MASPEEIAFNKAFGQRLFWVRDTMMHQSRAKFAKSLGMGVTADMLKRYETRDEAAFPLFLLPELIRITHESYEFWIGTEASKFWARQADHVLVDFRTSKRTNPPNTAVRKR